MDGGIDRVWTVSGRGTDGTFLTLNGRYQLNARMGLGGNGSYFNSGGQNSSAASVYGDLDWSQGSSRLQFSAAQ